MFNKIIYRFILNQSLNLIINTLLPLLNALISYIEVKNTINFTNMEIKLYYNQKHYLLFL